MCKMFPESKIGFLNMKKALTLVGSEKGRALLQSGHRLTARHWADNKALVFCPYKKHNLKKTKARR